MERFSSIPGLGTELADAAEQRRQRPGTIQAAARHTNDHHGLGLSIVRAIADAHDAATLSTRPQPRGGLQIEITFPPVRMR